MEIRMAALCAAKYRRLRDSDSLPVSRSIVQQVLVSGRAILSRDAGVDTQIKLSDSVQNFDIRSIMCVPINREDGDCVGVIQLDSRDRVNQFSEEDLALLICASLLAARAMEVARLHEERQELEAATRIQRSLLPTVRPTCAGLQFFDYYAPAQRVSGDYYDYIRLPGNRLAVVVGDVAGKGMSAALLMAHLAAATRCCFILTAPPKCGIVPEQCTAVNVCTPRSLRHRATPKAPYTPCCTTCSNSRKHGWQVTT